VDKNDPNYNSEEDRKVVYKVSTEIREEVEKYKQRVAGIIDEYFDNNDINETATLLYDLDLPHFAQYFVKKAIVMALDRRDREREMVSVLLSSLYNEVVYPDQMRKGFLSVVEAVDDLKLDVPEAVDLVSLFVARAIVDDIVPPAIVSKAIAPEGSAMEAVLQQVEVHLAARHCTEKLLRCWGGAAGLNYQDTKDSIVKMLFEYTSSHDIDEARRCLWSLGVKFFHHEFVKQAIHMAMETKMHRGAFIDLLSALHGDGELSDVQVQKGISRVATRLDDTVLDNPSAKEQFAEVVEVAKAGGLIKASLEEILTEANAERNAGHPHPYSIGEFKKVAKDTIREYFGSSDVEEVATRLLELEEPGLHHIFVKHAVQLAMDRKDREREMVCVLFSALYPQVLTGDQLGQGFTRLLASAEDLVLDNPDAAHLLSLFTGRIIIDEVLPPSFLTTVLGVLPDKCLGIQIVQSTGSMLSARHASERLLNCFHGGAKDVEQIRSDIMTMLREYMLSKDIKEVSRCLHDLSVPFYHHELVRRALEMALDSDMAVEAVSKMLEYFADSGEINETQMKKGFDRVAGMLDDLALDYPQGKERFATIKAKADKGKWLEANPKTEA